MLRAMITRRSFLRKSSRLIVLGSLGSSFGLSGCGGGSGTSSQATEVPQDVELGLSRYVSACLTCAPGTTTMYTGSSVQSELSQGVATASANAYSSGSSSTSSVSVSSSGNGTIVQAFYQSQSSDGSDDQSFGMSIGFDGNHALKDGFSQDDVAYGSASVQSVGQIMGSFSMLQAHKLSGSDVPQAPYIPARLAAWFNGFADIPDNPARTLIANRYQNEEDALLAITNDGCHRVPYYASQGGYGIDFAKYESFSGIPMQKNKASFRNNAYRTEEVPSMTAINGHTMCRDMSLIRRSPPMTGLAGGGLHTFGGGIVPTSPLAVRLVVTPPEERNWKRLTVIWDTAGLIARIASLELSAGRPTSYVNVI